MTWGWFDGFGPARDGVMGATKLGEVPGGNPIVWSRYDSQTVCIRDKSTAELLARAPDMDAALVALRDAAAELIADVDNGGFVAFERKQASDGKDDDSWSLQVSVKRVNALLSFVRLVHESAGDALGDGR